MKIIRWSVRLALLGVAGVLAAGGVVPEILGRWIPSLSPLAVFSTALAHRGWYLAIYWLIGPVLMLVLAFWRGRLFCRWMCPVGTLVSLSSRAGVKNVFWRWRVNASLFWIVIVSSLLGLPLLLMLDPLATFQRAAAAARGVYFGLSLVPGLLLPVLLVLCVVQPMIWCTHICPLGYGLELLQRLRRDKPRQVFQRTRRHLLIGLAVGVPVGLLGRWAFRRRVQTPRTPILPPGAKDEENFAATCIRCYACVSACPMRILQPVGPADRMLGQWFQPEVVYKPSAGEDEGYCEETCTICTNVCPTGAIRTLTLHQKRQRKIGTAKVIREACLAWADNRDCMVCQEHCSYGVIETEWNESETPRPIIREDICRGCGQCYHACPAVRQGKAIRIQGVKEQTEINDGYADLFEEG
ncbi:MAG: 4Fe-4S binding protein [Phycisphaerae bacterium]|nr:4Fe-4S binding protein [Phycisphaerae bacterium]